MNETFMKEKPVLPLLLSMALPNVVSMLVNSLYNIVDSRYRSRKPLIVTTNLSLTELQNPQDTAHARIYDRVLEMCLPILFTGENFRKETAQAKLNGLKELLK